MTLLQRLSRGLFRLHAFRYLYRLWVGRPPRQDETLSFMTLLTETEEEHRRRTFYRHVRQGLPQARKMWPDKRFENYASVLLTGEEIRRLQPIIRRYQIHDRLREWLSYDPAVTISNLAKVMIIILTPFTISWLYFSHMHGFEIQDFRGGYLFFIICILIAVIPIDHFMPRPKIRHIWLLASFMSFYTVNEIFDLDASIGLPMRFGITTFVLMVACFGLIRLIDRLIWNASIRRTHRSATTHFPASHIIAAEMWALMVSLQRLRSSCLQGTTRLSMLRAVNHVHRTLIALAHTSTAPKEYRKIQIVYPGHKFQQAATYVLEIGNRITETRTRADFDGLMTDLKEAVFATLRDDWSSLPEPQPYPISSRLLVIAKRLVTPLALGAVAFLLPHLPFLSLDQATMTAVRVALVVSALLALTSVDTDAKKQILGLFQLQPRGQ